MRSISSCLFLQFNVLQKGCLCRFKENLIENEEERKLWRNFVRTVTFNFNKFSNRGIFLCFSSCYMQSHFLSKFCFKTYKNKLRISCSSWMVIFIDQNRANTLNVDWYLYLIDNSLIQKCPDVVQRAPSSTSKFRSTSNGRNSKFRGEKFHLSMVTVRNSKKFAKQRKCNLRPALPVAKSSLAERQKKKGKSSRFSRVNRVW